MYQLNWLYVISTVKVKFITDLFSTVMVKLITKSLISPLSYYSILKSAQKSTVT